MKDISRRDFLKVLGAAGVATAGITACTRSADSAEGEVPAGYDRSVPKLRQADHCIGCNQCSPHCPQRIDIPSELHRIDNYVNQLRIKNYD